MKKKKEKGDPPIPCSLALTHPQVCMYCHEIETQMGWSGRWVCKKLSLLVLGEVKKGRKQSAQILLHLPLATTGVCTLHSAVSKGSQ